MTGKVDNRAEQGLFSMGNGYVLAPILDPSCGERRTRRWYRRLLRQHKIGNDSLQGLVFSCEPWVRKLPQHFNLLLQRCAFLGVDRLRLLLVIRDPLEHAVSVYGQMIKRHGYIGTLEDWLEIYDFPSSLLTFLQQVTQFSDQISLKVNHYSQCRRNLVDPLRIWLNFSQDSVWQEPSRRFVNRSLTYQELALMRLLNQHSKSLAPTVGELLVDQLPDLVAESPMPSETSQEHFVSKWTSTVNDINALLPCDCQLTLQVHSGRVAEPLQANAVESASANGITLLPSQLNCLFQGLTQSVSSR